MPDLWDCLVDVGYSGMDSSAIAACHDTDGMEGMA